MYSLVCNLLSNSRFHGTRCRMNQTLLPVCYRWWGGRCEKMGTKVELHQFINHAVDIHDSKSTVNYVYLNRVLHELAKHMGISNMEVNSRCTFRYFWLAAGSCHKTFVQDSAYFAWFWWPKQTPPDHAPPFFLRFLWTGVTRFRLQNRPSPFQL